MCSSENGRTAPYSAFGSQTRGSPEGRLAWRADAAKYCIRLEREDIKHEIICEDEWIGGIYYTTLLKLIYEQEGFWWCSMIFMSTEDFFYRGFVWYFLYLNIVNKASHYSDMSPTKKSCSVRITIINVSSQISSARRAEPRLKLPDSLQ